MEATLVRLDGTFAFALWDTAKRVLTLVRDRLGEKSLYFRYSGSSLLFGSDLAAFKSLPGYEPEIDRDVLALYLRHNYIPAPYSIYHDIRKLEPVEFAMRVTQEFKQRIGQSKWLLRQVLYRYVSRDLTNRLKMGFGNPIEQRLRRPLREWAEALLDKDRLDSEVYFDSVPVRKMWTEHQPGERRWHAQLWAILMLQAWLEQHHQKSVRSDHSTMV